MSKSRSKAVIATIVGAEGKDMSAADTSGSGDTPRFKPATVINKTDDSQPVQEQSMMAVREHHVIVERNTIAWK